MVAKKKKKPVANPARGFATTSIASKLKLDKATDSAPDTPETGTTVTPAVSEFSEHAETTAQPTKELHQVSPEELESQLELDELQILVEKYASKTRRESFRQMSRIQTDRRVLRQQAQIVTTRDWLPEELMLQIIDLAKVEANHANQAPGQQSLLKLTSEEDATIKLWALLQVLNDLGISQDHARQALKWLCANLINIDSGPHIWGLQESLEWLALNCEEQQLLPYDSMITKPGASSSHGNSRPGTPPHAPPAPPQPQQERDIKLLQLANPEQKIPTNSILGESDHAAIDVSDLESDLEPDQLVSKYLSVKTRLFDINPEYVEPKLRKHRGRNTENPGAPQTAQVLTTVHKLQSQLRQIEIDALFDQYDADLQWMAKVNQLAQDSAGRRKLGLQAAGAISSLAGTSAPQPTNSTGSDPVPGSSSEDSVSQDTEDFGDDNLLGDMFSAVPDEDPHLESSSTGNSEGVVLRDFGKQTGLNPRKVLEETIRARDSDARLSYKLVSPTTYSCRHSLTIAWSKDPEIVYEVDIPGVVGDFRPRSSVFTAMTTSTVSVQQSEGYISTAALFSLFSASSKEEKVYLRLPSIWRDLYKEFLETRKERLDATDRAAVKDLRSIVRDQIDREETEGVVLTGRFKKRIQGSGAVSGNERPKQDESGSVAKSEKLKDLWKQKASTPAYERMLPYRFSLPIFGFRETALNTIDHHQVTILCGETGCGKSTQLPAFILEHELSQGNPCRIYCTEPRRISAISLAQRVSQELGEFKNELGTSRSLVGYAIRLESNTSTQTRLVYVTVGIVLRMLESSRGLDDITHLIIDEVHERSIDTDFLLIVLRSLMLRRPELKVVLMSATVDAQRFSRYFNDAPIINVPGRTFPVHTKYLEDAVEMTQYTTSADGGYNDSDTSENEDAGAERTKSGIPKKLPGYSNTTRNTLATYDEYRIDYDIIVRLIEQVSFDPNYNQYSNAFLVFLPGIAEIRQLNNILLNHPSFSQQWLVYPLHSMISSEDQQQAFLLPPPGVRKIVLATNIAETGVTIPDITCVIDTGKHKEMRFDERRQLSRLTQSFISRANAKQRRGRAGRVQNGLCFHLFTKYRHDELMAEQQTPEMLRLSLQDLVMRIKICKLGDIEKTLSAALDPPSSKNIRRAIDALIEVDALTPSEDLTSLGRQLAKLPLDAHLGKLVLLAVIFSCVDVAITMAAILSSKSPFLTPLGARDRADAARLSFKRSDSDLLTAYNAYKTWRSICMTPGQSEMRFCHRNFLSSQNLSNIEDLKSQLLSSLVDAAFVQLPPDERKPSSRYRNTWTRTFVSVPAQYDRNSDNDALINSVIAAAFYPKILTRDGKGWRNIANNQTVNLAPTSVNKGTQQAQFLSYYHIMQSSSKFYNAHSTSVIHTIPMILMVGGEVDWRIHAGVVSLGGNNLRFKVGQWKVLIALKVLRGRVKDIVEKTWKNPGRQLGAREERWIQLFFKVFELEKEKSDRIEGSKGKAKGARG